jgi:hypothetical protein
MEANFDTLITALFSIHWTSRLCDDGMCIPTTQGPAGCSFKNILCELRYLPETGPEDSKNETTFKQRYVAYMFPSNSRSPKNDCPRIAIQSPHLAAPDPSAAQ